MSHKIKAVNGVSINVEDIGTTGKPIVFVHGPPVNHNIFEYQFTKLPKGLATIQVPSVMHRGVNDHVCLFNLAKVTHDGIKGS
ncbi:MAG: alpha/beta hydrolase [Nitrososphaeraceae archaeon]